MNFSLMAIELILSFVCIIGFYKKLNKEGLYLWIVLASIIAGILPAKTVSLLSVEISSGLILYTSIFLASNILIQKYGKDEIRTILTYIALGLGFFYVFSYILESLNSFYMNQDAEVYVTFLNLNLRQILSYSTCLLFSLLIEMNLYYNIRKNKNKIWMSNIYTLTIMFFVDSILFVILTFAGLVSIEELLILILISYILKIFVGSIGTPLIYLSTKIK